MPKGELRHISFSKDPKVASEQASENARDANLALSGKVSGYFVQVDSYAAQGLTTVTLPIRAASLKTPKAVLCVNAQATYDPGTTVNASTFRNFTFANGSINTFEPSGLTANTMYNLTFLVLE